MDKRQLFREADTKPANERIALEPGTANDTYVTFKQYDIDVEWRYYKNANA